jgi:hypothetical protein
MCIFFCNFVALLCACAYMWRVCARITRALLARTMSMHAHCAHVGDVVPVGVNIHVNYKLYDI